MLHVYHCNHEDKCHLTSVKYFYNSNYNHPKYPKPNQHNYLSNETIGYHCFIVLTVYYCKPYYKIPLYLADSECYFRRSFYVISEGQMTYYTNRVFTLILQTTDILQTYK